MIEPTRRMTLRRMWIASTVLGVDRGVAHRAGGEEQLLVTRLDVELHREAVRGWTGIAPVVGSVALAADWPWPCAQTMESTFALMIRPG